LSEEDLEEVELERQRRIGLGPATNRRAAAEALVPPGSLPTMNQADHPWQGRPDLRMM
jgi:hypothetical protein